MKKISFLVITVLALMAVPSQAQFKWGLKAGMNVSNISTDAKSNIDSYTGFQVGPITEFTVPLLGLGFDAALLYSQRGFKVADQTTRLSYMEVPVNLKYKFMVVPILLGAYATAGPYLSYRLSGSNAADSWKDYQSGLNFGFGVDIVSKLQIGANYQLGLTKDYLDAANKKESAKNSTWTISAAYFF